MERSRSFPATALLLGLLALAAAPPLGAAVTVYTDRAAWEAAAGLSTLNDLDSETPGDSTTPVTLTDGTVLSAVSGPPITVQVFNAGFLNGSREILFRDFAAGLRFTLPEATRGFGFDYYTGESWVLSAGGKSTALKIHQKAFLGYLQDSGTLDSFTLTGPTGAQGGIFLDNLLSASGCGSCHDDLAAKLDALTAIASTTASQQTLIQTQVAATQAAVFDLDAQLADVKMEIKALAVQLGCLQPTSEAVVCPHAQSLTKGTLDSGGHTSLCASDNQYLIYRSAPSKGLRRIEWNATFQVGSPSSFCSLSLQVEGNLGLREDQVELTVFNWSTGNWDPVGHAKFPKSPTDNLSSFALSKGSVSASGEVRIRVYSARKPQVGPIFHMATDALRLRLKKP